MNLSNNPSEKVSKSPISRIRALIAAIALSITACVSPDITPPADNPFGTAETTECDIDNPIFIALVSIGAEVQAGMECRENCSLQCVRETVSNRLNEMDLTHEVSVSLCPIQQTERGFVYIFINVADQQTQIFAKDRKTAEQRVEEIRKSCVTYIGGRVSSY